MMQPGINMSSFLSREPEIAFAYQLYLTCRNQIPYEYEFTKGGKGMRMLLQYTTGLAMLPAEGSLLDQPEYLMALFEEFLAGDEHGFHSRIQNKR